MNMKAPSPYELELQIVAQPHVETSAERSARQNRAWISLSFDLNRFNEFAEAYGVNYEASNPWTNH